MSPAVAARWFRRIASTAVAALVIADMHEPALAAACQGALQGDGIVSDIIDARTLRLHDDREVRLAGIEILAPDASMLAESALRRLTAGRAVTLHGASDMPDRYGRQPAFVFLDGADVPIQALLLKEGAAINAADFADTDCAVAFAAAESHARRSALGIWGARAIKSAKSPGDILARIGRFTVVEGKVLSVRQAGATTYMNFGRRWTQDFAVTISRRALPSIEAAGIAVKSLEGQNIRVRGWVGRRGGPRIEVTRAGQIEIGVD